MKLQRRRRLITPLDVPEKRPFVNGRLSTSSAKGAETLRVHRWWEPKHLVEMASNIYHSPYPMPAVPIDQSVSQFLLTSDPDDSHPETVIFADFDSPQTHKVTYAGLRNAASRNAATLRSRHGLRERDVMCIYGTNSVNWASLAHAALWAGACFWYA